MRSEIVAVVKDRQRLSALVPIEACRSGVHGVVSSVRLLPHDADLPGRTSSKPEAVHALTDILRFLIARR